VHWERRSVPATWLFPQVWSEAVTEIAGC
jgi:hypothetical protein